MFSFTSQAKYINWLEFKNILILLSVVLTACLVLYFLLCAKSKKGVIITKICLASALFVLEVSRILWWYFRCKHYGDPFNFWIRFNFEMCSMMVWVNIFTLIVSIFVKKDNKLVCYLYNIIFGAGMIGGILTFVYPAFIDSYYSIFHFRNLQSIITHILLIVSPLFLLRSKQFRIELKNFWTIPFSLVCVGSISTFAGMCANWNFAYCFYCAPFKAIGINIPFPFHILTIMLFISSVQFLLYTIIEVYRHKKKKDAYSKIGIFEIFCFVVTLVYTAVHVTLLNYLASYAPSLLGLVFLIPLIISISLVTSFYFIKYKNN